MFDLTREGGASLRTCESKICILKKLMKNAVGAAR